ncbi:MAG: hypothetical protein IPK53_10525 [bacterium]|nr:hypothetical protein [bacterium]
MGVMALATAVAADYQAIWNVTGGHPLALKPWPVCCDVLPLSTILGGLAQGGAGHIEEMYRHIYWQMWRTLSENGRRLLLTMPLVSETGGDPDYLGVISGLDETQFGLPSRNCAAAPVGSARRAARKKLWHPPPHRNLSPYRNY